MGHHIDTPNAVALYLDLDLLGIPRDDDPALIEKAHRALQAAQAKAKPLASPIMTLRSLIGLVRHRDTGHSILAIVIPDARLASPLDELAADAYDPPPRDFGDDPFGLFAGDHHE